MYRLSRAVVVIVAIALSTVSASAGAPGSEHTAAALMMVEHEWLTALNRHDVTTLTRVLGREYIDSDYQGDAITRAQYLAFFAHPVSSHAPHLRQTFEDTRVRFVAGGDVAIVTGVVLTQPESGSTVATSSSPDAVSHSRFTDVFVWREARWQVVTGQETHFTPDRKSR